MTTLLNRINFLKKRISEDKARLDVLRKEKETYSVKLRRIQEEIDGRKYDIARNSEQLKLVEFDYADKVKAIQETEPVTIVHEFKMHEGHFVEKSCYVVSKYKKSKRNNILVKQVLVFERK